MKTHLRSQLRLMRDMRNMATLNRRYTTDHNLAATARTWEARFDKHIRKLVIRLHLHR